MIRMRQDLSVTIIFRLCSGVLQNRTMLGALALSIGALGVRQTGLHLWAGVAFMALLALHLQQHRRVL